MLMSCKKYRIASRIILFLVCMFTIPVMGQTISGYVYDEGADQPLEGAFVYLDGTSLSAETDVRGYFTINTMARTSGTLVVSYTGFETARVENPFQYQKELKIMLRENIAEIEEVVITAKSGFTRKQMLRVFRKEFLGRSAAGTSCKIENEDDVNLYYDTGTNTLYATALKPLRISNKRLKYNIQFDLMHFQVDYHTKSLDSYNINRSFFAGTTFFKDVAVNGSADKKRKEAYLGSPAHFMRTIAEGDWEKQGYTLYVKRFPADPNEYFSIKDTLKLKKVTLIKAPQQPVLIQTNTPGAAEKAPSKIPSYAHIKFNLMYNGKQSFFIFNRGYFFIDKYGQYSPINELLFGGYMATLKAGDMLPSEYEP